MKFSVSKSMVDEAIQIAFPDDPSAFGVYAVVSSLLSPKFYILVFSREKMVTFFLGKLTIELREKEEFNLSEFTKFKISKGLNAASLSISGMEGNKRRIFVIQKRAKGFSDYQKDGIDKLIEMAKNYE